MKTIDIWKNKEGNVRHSLEEMVEKQKEERLLYNKIWDKYYKKIMEFEISFDSQKFDKHDEVKANPEEDKRKRKKNTLESSKKTRIVDDEEIQKEIDEIKSSKNTDNSNTVSVNGSYLNIGNIEFEKGDFVRIDMYGETFTGHILGINDNEIIIKSKNKNKMKVQISSLKTKKVTIKKIRDNDDE